jgi:tRNA threonylcarbamoyladenosine biosynthesis protein TsaE
MILGENQLNEFGRELSGSLRAGDVIALTGDLGTGKTTLTKALALGLGVTDPVTSPTFALINEYGGGRLKMYHFDVYRIAQGETQDAVRAEMERLGYEEYFYGDGVCVVEWADLIEDLLPPDAIRVTLAHTDDPEEREVAVL